MIEKIKNSGFTIELDGDGFIVSPSDKLTQQQCEFMKANKMQIMAELLLTTVYNLHGTAIMLLAKNATHQKWLISVNYSSSTPSDLIFGDE
jgi:hypothetical protein